MRAVRTFARWITLGAIVVLTLMLAGAVGGALGLIMARFVGTNAGFYAAGAGGGGMLLLAAYVSMTEGA